MTTHPVVDQPTLPAPNPTIEADTEPFWDAASQGRLVLPRCTGCGTVIWYPRAFCPACGSLEVNWIEAPGTGHVYSFSIARRGQGAYAEAAPYVLASVELDLPEGVDGPGPRVITNIVDCDVDDVAVDAPVTVVFHRTSEGAALVRFRLVGESSPQR